jgi:hypothetical protein
MKHIILTTAILFSLAGTVPVSAQQQAASEETPEASTSATETSATIEAGTTRPRHGMGMMRRGMGRHGEDHAGMQHGGGHPGKHARVVQRLDIIEARLAKIEAMLEILIRR